MQPAPPTPIDGEEAAVAGWLRSQQPDLPTLPGDDTDDVDFFEALRDEDESETPGMVDLPQDDIMVHDAHFGPSLPDQFWQPTPVSLPSGKSSSSAHDFERGEAPLETKHCACNCRLECWKKLAAHAGCERAQQEIRTSKKKAEADKIIFDIVSNAMRLSNGQAKYMLCGEQLCGPAFSSALGITYKRLMRHVNVIQKGSTTPPTDLRSLNGGSARNQKISEDVDAFLNFQYTYVALPGPDADRNVEDLVAKGVGSRILEYVQGKQGNAAAAAADGLDGKPGDAKFLQSQTWEEFHDDYKFHSKMKTPASITCFKEVFTAKW